MLVLPVSSVYALGKGEGSGGTKNDGSVEAGCGTTETYESVVGILAWVKTVVDHNGTQVEHYTPVKFENEADLDNYNYTTFKEKQMAALDNRGSNVKVLDVPEKIDKDDTTEIIEETTNTDNTRHYGLTIFHGYVSVAGNLTKESVIDTLKAGHSPIAGDTAHLGGGKSSMPMKGAYDKYSPQAALARQIQSQSETGNPQDFFDSYGTIVDMSYKSFVDSISNAGSVTVPYVGVTLAMSSGSAGNICNILGTYNPYTITMEQFKEHFRRASGGDSLLMALLNDKGTVKVYDRVPIGTKYVFPVDGVLEQESKFIFGVQSTPKDGVTDWKKGASDRQGSFIINVMCSDVKGIDVTKQYSIKATISKGGESNYTGPYLNTVNIVKNDEVIVSGDRLAKGETIPIKIEVTGDGPQDKGHMVLNKGVCQVTVQVSDGTSNVTANYSPEPRLNDEQSKGSGPTGYNYVAWKGSDIEEPDLEKIPWAQHSASEPMIRGTLGANEFENEDFNIGIGIPSTENVYILAGGETAISDMAGYFVLHSSRDFSEVSMDNQGENEEGVPASNPSVKREIMLKCSVQNTWGMNNTLCHRKAASFGVSGGDKSESGGGSNYSCTGHVSHSGSHGGSHSGGSHNETKGTQNDVVRYDHCVYHGTRWEAGTGKSNYVHGHNTCGTCKGCKTDEEGNTEHPSCGEPINTTCTPKKYMHDCTWSVTVYDGDKNDSVNEGIKGSEAYDLPSFTLTTTGDGDWVKLSPTALKIDNYKCEGKDWGQDKWLEAVRTISIGNERDCTAWIKGSIEFTPVANQYFHLSGSFTIGNNANGTIVTKKGRTSGHWEGTGAEPTTDSVAGSVETVTLAPSNPTDELCNGYSYATGSRCDEFENCYHMKEHNYTLKYLETIDFYVFRSITDAHLASMRGSKIKSVNQVTRSGYESNNGTFGAPMADSAVGQSVTAPESVGYLWRAVNSTFGSYVNGEGLETKNGEYNGRILFEIWKDPEVGAGGALSYEFNTNFCLGNAEIKAVLLQDNKFGNDPSIYPAQLTPTEALESIPSTVPNRGDTDNRYNHDWVTSKEKGKGKGSTYAGGNGDCLNKGFEANTIWEANDETTDPLYRDIIISEQNAIVNYWQGKNKDDNYHANVISDSLCYGNSTNTTQVVGEYYTVDDGIPLFNYLGGAKGRSNIDDYVEGPIYRNHHSKVGSTGKQLADFMMGYNAPTSPSMREGDHFGFFGYGGSNNGGDIALADSLTGKCVEGTIYEIENGNKGSWVPGADVIIAYKRKMGSQVTNGGDTNSGITEFQLYLKDKPQMGGDSFAGYWADHEYPAHVSETIYGRYNGSSGNDLIWSDADCTFNGTNSGTLNEQEYGQSLLMHNLPLVDWTPNSKWPTAEISNAYGWLIDMPGGFEDVTAELYANGVYDTHKSLVQNELGLQLSETIRIYDPISAEESYNIGNQYGSWEDGVKDESGFDQRVTSIGKNNNDFSAIGNYVNTYTYLWTWIAPFGDFSSVGGTSGAGSDITSAEVYRNKGMKGYTSDMYIGTWTKNVHIQYPFVARTSYGGVSEDFWISELDSVYGNGGSPYMEANYGPASLRDFWRSVSNPPFKFGNAVGAVNTVNCVEGKNVPVIVTAYAINDGIKSSDNSCEYGESVNDSGRNDDKWCNAASKIVPIDIVGQIGNLAIHDTTDFRFSTYFRKPTDTWLMDGIIKNAENNLGVNILAEPKDILFEDAYQNLFRHATLSATLEFIDDNYRGMSGEFGLLPLTPAYITVPEFKTDALRLGYKVFASIETIGNYEAALRPGTKYPTNYDQAQDEGMDTRQEYMDIVSEYYLYDFDTGKFYAVDLWSGPEGAKQCIYSGSDRKVHPQLNSEPLYINMDEESNRRNVTFSERRICANYAEVTSEDTSIYTAMYSGLEFIGYTGNIRLDTMDLTYCGSDAVYGKTQFSQQSGPNPDRFYNTSQRWHFTSGLTSTTVPTVPIYKDGANLTATQVENAAKSMRDKHPNSVIIEFQNYIAKGNVWTLKYKGSLMNTKNIKFYSDPEDCPYDEKSHIETEYQGYKVYNPETGTEYGSQTIDKDSTPLVAYEAYKSNSEDRTVAGTH